MRYLIVEWNTENIIEEFESNAEREKWVTENCYLSENTKAVYTIKGNIRVEFADDCEKW